MEHRVQEYADMDHIPVFLRQVYNLTFQYADFAVLRRGFIECADSSGYITVAQAEKIMTPLFMKQAGGDFHHEARLQQLHDILLNVAKEHATEDRKMLGQKKKKADALMETRIDAVTFMNNFGTVHELMVDIERGKDLPDHGAQFEKHDQEMKFLISQ